MPKKPSYTSALKEVWGAIDDIRSDVRDIHTNHLDHIKEGLGEVKGKMSILIWVIPIGFSLLGILMVVAKVL